MYCIALKGIAGLDQGPDPCYSNVYHTVKFPLLHTWVRCKTRVVLFFSLLTAVLVGTIEGTTSKFFFSIQREVRPLSNNYSMGESPVASPLSTGKGQGKVKEYSCRVLGGTHLGNVLQLPEYLHHQSLQPSLPFMQSYFRIHGPHAELFEGY